MIGKITKGASFYGVVNYLESKVKQGVGLLLSTNLFGNSIAEKAGELETVSTLRPRLSKPVFHVSLNLPPGESLTDDTFREIADKYMNKMGFDDNQYLVYRHHDQEHSHIHIVCNRVKYSGELTSDQHDFRRSELIMREFEKEYGLFVVHDSQLAIDKPFSKKQYEKYQRTGEIPAQMQLQQIIKNALKNKPSIHQFIEEIQRNGVEIKLHHNKEKIFGISYALDGVAFKGSKLGRGYTWGKLKNQINYDEKRHLNICRAASHRGAQQDTGTTSRTLTGSEYLQYSAAQGGHSADIIKPPSTDYRPSGTGFEIEKDLSQLGRNAQYEQENSHGPAKNKPKEYIPIFPSGIIGGSTQQLSDLDSDDEAIKKKKRRKGKKRKKSMGF